MDGKLIILGCGGSAGVPTIGNWWGNCDPNEPKNLRTRPSIAIQTQKTLVVVDAGPDFRDQINREKLGCPDALIITHSHSDHINGIDEFRTLQRLNKGRKFPLYAMEETMKDLHVRLDYMFKTSDNGFYLAVFDAHIINIKEKILFSDVEIQTFSQMHGDINSLGIRIKNIGYSTDVKKLDDHAFECLKGIDIWIADAAGDNNNANPVHASIEEVIRMNERIGAKKVYLTHLPPSMDYQTLIKNLPKGYEPAYDGLVIDF